jgi:hypothetical protein
MCRRLPERHRTLRPLGPSSKSSELGRRGSWRPNTGPQRAEVVKRADFVASVRGGVYVYTLAPQTGNTAANDPMALPGPN